MKHELEFIGALVDLLREKGVSKFTDEGLTIEMGQRPPALVPDPERTSEEERLKREAAERNRLLFAHVRK